MELSAVLLARVFYFFESSDLNPRGAVYFPDLVRALVEKYGFQKFPQKLEEMDESKGIEFATGKIGKKTIEKVSIYTNGIAVDTRSSTKDSEEILLEALVWGTGKMGLKYRPEMLLRKAYISQVTFHSDSPLLDLCPEMDDITKRLNKIVSGNMRLESNFGPSGFRIMLDPESQRIPIAGFILERRQGAAYAENKYFSAAPLETDTHLSFLEEFEKSILARRKRN
jgi:hypothetical protein